ncbi:B-cell antigen receptor complex-associated protein alpha chain [Poecilia latipinna]|uniref:CD79a molecule, immunoglobulin-associated alpha n=2 Tax=Poecilia TaxID=8080 RepID=A0A087XA96_POEFO|nr:PREDICTED: B-cell antigen receptor complex-associated protein alpha chain [Poecilia formosa]XP_014908220.1 PREDICTED: B-cell antigen receptor complex-associated protein alpha chain [Poecilia latipinna]
MGVFQFFVLCSLMGSVASNKDILLEPDRPFLRVRLFDRAELECCYKNGPANTNVTWVNRFSYTGQMYPVNLSEEVFQNYSKSNGKQCVFLILKNVKLTDTGMYQCHFNNTKVYSHGTYLQVFKPIEKTINLSESTKNKILTAEGVLLLLCVVIPSASLLFKSKKQNKLEMKKMKQEEENIYQGLNLEDCCSTYDQIERSQGQSQYQDVCTAMEEKEEILEKP